MAPAANGRARASRNGISARLRFEILRRDNYQCRYCGRGADEAPLDVDHVVPVSLGGKTEPSNLATACFPCNSGKASMAPDQAVVEDVRVDAEAWARAREAATKGARTANAYVGFDREIAAFDQHWNSWSTADRPLPRDANWQRTLRIWFLRDVPLDVVLDMADNAMGRTYLASDAVWKYFCGCVWGWIRKVEEETERIYAEDQASAVYYDVPRQSDETPEPTPVEVVIALGPAS